MIFLQTDFFAHRFDLTIKVIFSVNAVTHIRQPLYIGFATAFLSQSSLSLFA